MKPTPRPVSAAGAVEVCRHCKQPLDLLARRRGLKHCGVAACRQRAEAEVLKARWQGVAAHALQQAAEGQQTGGKSAAPALLWLRPANRELEPVTDDLREALADAWRRGAADGWRYVYEGRDSARALPAEATTLCVQCGGACCAHGGTHNAFVDADVLARWQAAHPGSSTEDAVAHYLAQLPAVHIKHGCGFQTATGCALPRESRADVCNRYACEPLLELAHLLQETPGRAAVVLTPDGRKLERAALMRNGHITPITGLPQPDELPAEGAAPAQ